MPAQVLTNARLFVDGRDLSGQMNALGVEYGVDALDGTTLMNDTRINVGGLKTTTMSHQGYWAASDDAHMFARIGPSAIVTVCPVAADSGAVSYFENVMHATYSVGGAVGELYPFSFDAEAAGPLVRATVLRNPATAPLTSSARSRRDSGFLPRSTSSKSRAAGRLRSRFNPTTLRGFRAQSIKSRSRTPQDRALNSCRWEEQSPTTGSVPTGRSRQERPPSSYPLGSSKGD
jgi:hypothetical protein